MPATLGACAAGDDECVDYTVVALKLLAVMLGSVAAGLGELSFLAYTSFFDNVTMYVQHALLYAPPSTLTCPLSPITAPTGVLALGSRG